MIKKNFSLLLLVITIFPLCSGSLDVGLNGESGSFGEIGLDLNLNPLDIDFGGNYSINVNSTEWWNTAIGPLDNADATQHNNVGGVLTISETYLRSFGDGEWLQLDGGNSPSAHINWGGFNLFNVNNLTVDGYINGIGDKITNVVHLLYNETIDGRKTFTDTIICENNMIINGDFATDSDWTLGGTATISGGKGNFGSNTATFTQDIGVEVGKKYIVTFTLSSLAGGPVPAPYVQFTLGGVTGSVRGSDNTYTQEITATNTNPLVFQAGGVLTGASIDDVSVIGYGIIVEGRGQVDYLDVEKELLVEGTDNSGKFSVVDSDDKNMFNVDTASRNIKVGNTDYITFSENGGGGLDLSTGGFCSFQGTGTGVPTKGLGYINNALLYTTDFENDEYFGQWSPDTTGFPYFIQEWANFNTGLPVAPLVLANARNGSTAVGGGITYQKDMKFTFPDLSSLKYSNLRIGGSGGFYGLTLTAHDEIISTYDASGGNSAEAGYKATAGASTSIISAFEVGDGTITNALDCNDKNIIDVKDINIDGDTILGDSDTDTITFNAKSASNILPQITDTYSIGSSLLKWLNGYFINLFVTNATIENLNMTGTLTTGISHMHGLATEIQTVTTIDTWYNVTFNASLGDTYNIGFEDNRTLVISHDGHYTINFGCGIMDDSPSPNANVGMRITNNGAEVSGSYVEVDTTKQNADLWIEHTTHSEFSLGDELNMQYIASDTDVTMEQEDTYALQGFNCYGYLQEVIL